MAENLRHSNLGLLVSPMECDSESEEERNCALRNSSLLNYDILFALMKFTEQD